MAGRYLDLSFAFDSVDHEILLKNLGIRDKCFDLFHSYLTNRKQFVEINNIENGVEKVAKSKFEVTKRGLPQG